MMYQAGVAKIDIKTKEVKGYPYPDEWVQPSTLTSMVSPNYSNVDGKVWANNQRRASNTGSISPTGKWENMGVADQDPRGKKISGYGMPVDKNNNVFMLEFSGTSVGLRDAKNNHVTIYPTPIAGSRPRRGRIDEQQQSVVRRIRRQRHRDARSEDRQVQGMGDADQYDKPYDVVPTKNGEAWTGSMFTDLVTRLDTKTGEMVQYLLPRTTNIRRVFVDETGPRQCSGSAATTAPRSSRSSRSTEIDSTHVTPGLPGGSTFLRIVSCEEMHCRVKPGNDERLSARRSSPDPAPQRKQRPIGPRLVDRAREDGRAAAAAGRRGRSGTRARSGGSSPHRTAPARPRSRPA